MPDYRIETTFHTGFTVSNLERTVGFFRDVLGFEVTGRDQADAAFMARLTGVEGAEARLAFLKLPGHAIELIEYIGAAKDRPSDLRPCDPGFAHIAFTVENIDALVEACRDYGLRPYQPVLRMDQGPAEGTKVVYLRDPDGLTIELIEWSKGQAV